MPIVLQRVYAISGNYTPAELEIYQKYIDDFRLFIADDEPERYLLRQKTQYYTDNKIISFLNLAMRDINNAGDIRTNYSLQEFDRHHMDMDIIQGAVIFACIAEGFLQTANQIDFNDSGLSIAMFNKTNLYQTWYGLLAQEYLASKASFKATILPSSSNAGFLGIKSEFGYRSIW